MFGRRTMPRSETPPEMDYFDQCVICKEDLPEYDPKFLYPSCSDKCFEEMKKRMDADAKAENKMMEELAEAEKYLELNSLEQE